MGAVSEDAIERNRRSSREAKRRRSGTCVDCGAPTRYGGKRGQAVSQRCLPCGNIAAGAERKIWTPEACIAAMHRWERERGRPPMQHDWYKDPGDGYPTHMSVVRAFGSWSAGKRAAGYGDGRAARGH